MQTLSIPPTDADRVLGRLDAQVVIVEYGDYDCPHTRRAHGFLKELRAQDPGGLSLVYRQFPLRHLHRNAQKLSELMLAIRDPEQFWAAHDRLMAQPRMSLEVAEHELGALGLALSELERRSAEAALAVQADVERGLSDGVHSTPSFFFNAAPHDGRYDLDTLQKRIDMARARLS